MRSSRIIAAVLMIIVLFSGCTNAQKLSDMTIVEGFAIDGKDGETSVTLQYLNLSKSTGSAETMTETITSVVTGNGKNISDAIFSASNSLSENTFFGQNKVIVFGSQYVRNDLSKGLDYLLRSAGSRPDVYVALAAKKGEDIIKNKEHGARIPAENVYNLIDNTDDNGIGVSVNVNDLLNFYSDPTADMFMPMLRADKESVSCDGIAVFRDNEYALTLDADESLGFNLIHGRVDDGPANVHTDSMGTIGIIIKKTKTKCKVFVKDNHIYFDCHVDVNFVLNDVENGTTVSVNEKRINEIEKSVCSAIVSKCTDAFIACIHEGCDPFLIGRYLSKYDRDIYSYYSKDWHRHVRQVRPVISARAKLIRVNDNSLMS